MIKRLLIVLGVGVGIVFVPYFLGKAELPYFDNVSIDTNLLQWLRGALYIFIGFFSSIMISLIWASIIDLKNYIKGD